MEKKLEYASGSGGTLKESYSAVNPPMRTRDEIELYLKALSLEVGERFTIEILLDIRDLLTKLTKEK